MSKRTKKILVTGATGQIGSELTLELRKKYGKDNVVAAGHRPERRCERILKVDPFQLIEITDKENLVRVVEKYEIDTIYHLAGVLSAVSEQNPELAWRVNFEGLYNVLEIAREHELVEVFWPSSIGAFGGGSATR